MLAQTTFFIALLATIALGALSTNLISSSVAHQEQVQKYQALADEGAVNAFTSLMQGYIAEHGSNGPWPTSIPKSSSAALCPALRGQQSCSYRYVISASITGFSSNSSPSAASALEYDDTANNLQQFLVDEQRLSASVTATVTDENSVTISSSTRFITLRVFNSVPYAMVSGEHEIRSSDGSNHAIEGDTGGTVDSPKNLYVKGEPNAQNPDSFHNTEIKASMNCGTVDEIGNKDAANPTHNQGRGNRGLPWGIGNGGGYELPCTDFVSTPSPGTFRNEDWQNGNARTGSSQ